MSDAQSADKLSADTSRWLTIAKPLLARETQPMSSLDLGEAETDACVFDRAQPPLTVRWWWLTQRLEQTGWRCITSSEPVEIEFWNRSTGYGLLVRPTIEGVVVRLPDDPTDVLVRQVSQETPQGRPMVNLAPVPFISLVSRATGKVWARLVKGDLRRLFAAVSRLSDRTAAITLLPAQAIASAGPTVAGDPDARTPTGDPVAWPLVSVVIPTKDHAHLLGACLKGLRADTDYPNLEVILVDNGTTDADALDVLNRARSSPDVTVLACPGPFNFSALCNAGVAASRGEIVVLLNNDVTPRSPDWLKILVREALNPDIGVVGPLLLYPNDTVQCATVAVGLGGSAGHPWRGVPLKAALANPWTGALRQVSALTGACLVLRRSVFDEVGGLDAENFPVSLNDIDFCLRIDASGLAVVYSPASQVIHHESRSRRSDHHPAEQARRLREQIAFRDRWRARVAQDPWYPPWLTRADESATRL